MDHSLGTTLGFLKGTSLNNIEVFSLETKLVAYVSPLGLSRYFVEHLDALFLTITVFVLQWIQVVDFGPLFYNCVVEREESTL